VNRALLPGAPARLVRNNRAGQVFVENRFA
jgi:hypothetical protein